LFVAAGQFSVEPAEASSVDAAVSGEVSVSGELTVSGATPLSGSALPDADSALGPVVSGVLSAWSSGESATTVGAGTWLSTLGAGTWLSTLGPVSTDGGVDCVVGGVGSGACGTGSGAAAISDVLGLIRADVGDGSSVGSVADVSVAARD
jgi:hypothetical protein